MNKQLDWKRAKEICEKYPGHEVSAGLSEDWFWTADTIFDGEKYISKRHSQPFVSSSWATPVVVVTLDEGYLEIPCWTYGDDADMPDWWGK